MRDHIVLYINGHRHAVRGEQAWMTLTDYLRLTLRLTGTKVVCAEGDCGSCTIALGRPERTVTGGAKVEYVTVCGCILRLYQLDAAHVVTVEGLAYDGGLNPVQSAMVQCNGAQCGFCTPGFVVTLHQLLQDGKKSDADVRRKLTGNLCRCTGYDAILDAARHCDRSTIRPVNQLYPDHTLAKALTALALEPVKMTCDGRAFYKPTSVADAIAFRSANPTSVVIAGGTDLGVVLNKRKIDPPILMSTAALPDFNRVDVRADHLSVGGGATHDAVQRAMADTIPEYFNYLEWFGSPQVRQAGTLAGNLATGSPIGDSLPPLLVLGARVELASPASGAAKVRIVELNDFYTGYRTSVMRSDELITRVLIPIPARGDVLKLYKISKRRDLDISTISAAILLRLDGDTVAEIRIAFGGVGPTVIRLRKTEAFLRGRPFTEETFDAAQPIVLSEITPISDVRGSADYRNLVGGNILRRLHAELAPAMHNGGGPLMSYVGQSIPLDTAPGHVSGRSQFIEDLPPVHGELLVGFYGSPVAHGRIKSIDFGDARSIPGVAGLYTHKDVPGHNRFGPVIQDELLLAEDETHFIGHPIVLIAADTLDAIEAARRAIKVDIETLPALFTIDEAAAAEAWIGPWREMGRGDVASAFATAPHTLEGTIDIGGQEHFYLENQACIVTPGEGGTCVVNSSTQHTTEVQTLVAEVLGVPFNHVTCICKRMGGGFGGKETQAAQPAMMAAVVARHTGRTARFVYNKDDDMRFTGKRHPMKTLYRVAFDDAGNINGLDLTLHANGGCSTDLTLAIQERAMLHSDNAYFIPHKRIRARAVRTNLPSNTAFRGFGGPQGIAAMEAVIEDVAAYLGLDALDVRQRNCYGVTDRNVTHYGQIVGNNTLPKLFRDLRDESAYDARRKDIDRHNAHDRLTLRGLSLLPVKFGISFTRRTLNQANALVNIYTDGSVLVSTGATEMGQGVNTRIRQIVADELGVTWDSVRVTETNTDKNNNTSPTAASSGTDLNGNAALVACVKLRERLSEIAAKLLRDTADGLMHEPTAVKFHRNVVYDVRRPSVKIDFKRVVCEAYNQRVSLGERGHYVTPGVDFNRDTGRGHPFYYYTMGVACAEVSIDRFTGELRVPRVDLIMDVGLPINPGIDRGQIIGGFIQGMGWCTTEELKYGPAGQLLSYSPTTYKIPNVSDVPEIFNVRLLDNPDNHMSIKRSKAVGEPPLMLGLAVWTAVKDALNRQADAIVPLPLPATGEAIAMAVAKSSKSTCGPSPRACST